MRGRGLDPAWFGAGLAFRLRRFRSVVASEKGIVMAEDSPWPAEVLLGRSVVLADRAYMVPSASVYRLGNVQTLARFGLQWRDNVGFFAKCERSLNVKVKIRKNSWRVFRG